MALMFSDSDDDDAAALMAELAKIRQERAEEKARIVSAALSMANVRTPKPLLKLQRPETKRLLLVIPY
jgi:protein CWC15